MNLLDKILRSDLFLIVVSTLKITSFVSLLLTGGSFFIYSIGYAFLYGYYFSGELTQTNTWLEIVTVIVPFPFYSVLLVSSIVIISAFYLFHIVKLLKSKKLPDFILFILFWLFLNVLLTVIFTGAITLTNLLYLSLFWIVPIFLAMTTVIFKKIANEELSLSIVSALVYAAITNHYIQIIFKEEFFIFILFFLIFLFSTNIFSNKTFFVRFIKIVPIILLVNLIFIKMQDFLHISFPFNIKFLILILTTIILSYFYAKIYPQLWPKSEIANTSHDNAQEKNLMVTDFVKHINKKKPTTVLPVLTFFILAFVVSTPLISKETGKLMRTVTPYTSLKFEKISSSYLKTPIEGILVIEKNDILYISNKEGQLIRIKDEKYKTEPHE